MQSFFNVKKKPSEDKNTSEKVLCVDDGMESNNKLALIPKKM